MQERTHRKFLESFVGKAHPLCSIPELSMNFRSHKRSPKVTQANRSSDTSINTIKKMMERWKASKVNELEKLKTLLDVKCHFLCVGVCSCAWMSAVTVSLYMCMLNGCGE